ncbi:MAG: 3-methyl-2-oxobutanoate hydroxymethyltransferase [Alphaproteobacteria bacterium]
MSVAPSVKRLTSIDIMRRKNGAPIVALTAYQASIAAIADIHADILLVGDSLGMVIYGYDNTLPVTLDMMIAHGQAVVRGSKQALVIVDMPFGTYEESPEAAFRHASRVMRETGCGGIKLEGGASMAATIRYLAERGIPVMAHIGLTPQSVNALGGYKVQGRTRDTWKRFEDDAKAVSEAGAFAVVIEAMAEPLAARITTQIPIPTIGIGASAACDGQIMVTDDMLGMTPRSPKFVRRYTDLAAIAERAVANYAADVRARKFPTSEHTYAMVEAVPMDKITKSYGP